MNDVRYFKLPYIGKYSLIAQNKIRKIMETFCKNVDAKLVFNSTKIQNLFSYKSRLDNACKSNVVYKFCCANCNVCYIGETTRHLSTRISEHLSKDKSSHIFKHLLESNVCKEACDSNCFSILDCASTTHQLRLKEGMHIAWCKPALNKQVKHYSISITV